MALPSIPAQAFVRVTPSVIDAGGSGLDLVGLILTNETRVPASTVLNFASAADVSTYFGPSAPETAQAAIYFAGYEGSAIKPASILFAQYPATAVKPYLRGGDLGSMTIAQLQAITGLLTISIDGRNVTSGAINLSGAASFAQAATTIQTALNDQDATFTGVIAVTTGILTASSVTGNIAVGQTITGTGVPAGTVITGLISGTGGAGTYQTNIVTAVASTAMIAGATLVTYDAIAKAFVITAGTPGTTASIGYASNTASTALKLTAATGAVISPGAAAGTPATVMDGVYALTQNFASFTTNFMPNDSDRLAFAAWNAGKSNRFLYAMADTSSAPTVIPDTTSLGYQIAQLEYGGISPIYSPVQADAINDAVFLLGLVASMDFTRVNGRVTAAYRSGTGLTPGVTSQTVAANLQTNGYNFYGRAATANDTDNFFYPGQVSGSFAWIDSYVDQIQLNNAFQRTLMDLLLSIGSIPYNADGYALIEAAMMDPINNALSFGSIRAGVPLSSAQAAQVNAATGVDAASTLQQRGWYLQVQAPSASVRASRGSPPVLFFYMDGQSIQVINLSSVLVQ